MDALQPTQAGPPPNSFLGYLRYLGPGLVVVLTWLSAGDIVEMGEAGGGWKSGTSPGCYEAAALEPLLADGDHCAGGRLRCDTAHRRLHSLSPTEKSWTPSGSFSTIGILD